ncbi:MAG: hypothetical protein QME51_04670 [Planctomycetota bacterium]|nr:hypothetical protein [Planctomycetota bacterium]
MSRRTEERNLQAMKEMEVLKEIVRKIEPLRQGIEKEEGVAIYAKIEPIGPPTINCTLLKPDKKTIFTPNSKYEAHNKERAVKAMRAYENLCRTNGVVPIARIGERGAVISYILNNEAKGKVSGFQPKLMSEASK